MKLKFPNQTSFQVILVSFYLFEWEFTVAAHPIVLSKGLTWQANWQLFVILFIDTKSIQSN